MSFAGHLDEESRTVSVEGEGLDKRELRDLILWLSRCVHWLREREVADAGGRRWVFEHGRDGPVAIWKAGDVATEPVPLASTHPRKVWPCSACGYGIAAGELAWRQREGANTGASRERFCNDCVEHGGRRVPTLKVIEGGAA